MEIQITPHASGPVPCPGLYTMSAAQYHADPCPEPSLSSSIANTLISRTPRHAWHKHTRFNPAAVNVANAAMNFGSVVHEFILGRGGGYEVLPFEEFRTKEAKEAKAACLARGSIPIKRADLDRVQNAAAAIWERVALIEECRVAFVEEEGISETVLIWREGQTWCRAMLDWWDRGTGVYDLKTTGAGLDTRTLSRAISGGYDLQAAHYLRGLSVLLPELAGRLKWRWVFCETEAPHEVRVIQADGAALMMGEKKRAFALQIWQECMAANRWPGYPAQIERIEYPAFAEASWLERELSDDIAMRARPDLPGVSTPTPTHAIYGDIRIPL